MRGIVYIVGCAKIEDERWHIDSTWTSKRKAIKRCNELNSDQMSDWRFEYGYTLFEIQQSILSK